MQEIKSPAKAIITIITPSYNRAGMITDAIESVLVQDFERFEHIIVDGGSTDSTLDILAHYPHLKVISDSDQGMYDALNKGLGRATGEIIGFLNTDDLYAESIFPAIAKQFDDPAIMAVSGRAIVFSQLPDGQIKIVERYSPQERCLLEDLTMGGAFFNAWFFRRSTFHQIGKFNTSYRIAGDREFMLRFALNDLKYTAIPALVYKYRMHQDSLTFDKSSEKRTKSADEHLMMTSFYLTQWSLPHTTKKLLIRLRTLETVDMAARSVWRRNPKRFLHYLAEGAKYNLAWPLRFVQYVIRRGFAMISSK